MLRPSKKFSKLKVLKEIDAFPKISESYVETTAFGGILSLLGHILMLVLFASEIYYYTSLQLKFEYAVDKDYDGTLKLNVDLTVATDCKQIGADLLDPTNQHWDIISTEDLLTEVDLPQFALNPKQQAHWQSLKEVNQYLRNQYHAVHDVLWREGYSARWWGSPSDHLTADDAALLDRPKACKIFGSLDISKVPGNFHVISGKHLPATNLGHVHISIMRGLQDPGFNFSHRIERFFFGDASSQGVFDPLEGTEKIALKPNILYQYFIQIVPTDVVSPFGQVTTTYQYSVTEQDRIIDHHNGSHGNPGIFFKYSMFPVKVRVVRFFPGMGWETAVRVAAMLGGMHVTIGLLTKFFKFLIECWQMKFPPSKKDITLPQHQSAPLLPPECNSAI